MSAADSNIEPLDTPGSAIVQLWIMTGIADAFGVTPSTVQSYWRYRTLKGLREHLGAHGHPDPAAAVGVPLESLTAEMWQVRRRDLRVSAYVLPRGALPLPDLFADNKPMWFDTTIQEWAEATGRRRADGTFGRLRPPGRPVGSRDKKPRKTAGQPVGNVAGKRVAA